MQNKFNTTNTTLNEQDYLKAIFQLTIEANVNEIGTNSIAEKLSLSPGAVNLMIKKLNAKELIIYEKYGKVQLTPLGKQIALELVRKHRLWETFLFKFLNFQWEEVHKVAEQLEHIESDKLIEKLDELMNFPEFDPHGSIIPRNEIDYTFINHSRLSEFKVNDKVKVISIKDSDEELLKYATSINISIGCEIHILEKRNFDKSFVISIDGNETQVSEKFADCLFVNKL